MDLTAKLEIKQALLRDMLDSTQAMGKMVSEDDLDALSKEMSRRQKIIDEVDELDVSMSASTQLETYSPRHQRIKEEIEQILCEIKATDKELVDAAEQKRSEYGTQFKKVKETNKVIKGYKMPYSSKGSIFIDAKK